MKKPQESLSDPEFLLEELADHQEITMTLSREMQFVPTKAFEKQHGMTPAQAGVGTIEVTDETGAKVAGVAIDSGEPQRLRIDVKQGLVLQRHVAGPSDMLRPMQSSDLLKYLLVEREKQKSKQLKNPLTLQALQQALEEAKKKPPPPEPPQEKAPLQMKDAEKDGEKEDEEMPAPQVISKVGRAHGLLLLEQDGGGCAKGKGQGRGQGRGRGAGAASSLSGRGAGEKEKKKRPAFEAFTRTGPSIGDASSAAGSEGDLDCQSVSGESLSSQGPAKRLRSKTPGGTEVEKMQKQAEKYLGLLKPIDAILGKQMGNVRYNSERVLMSLKELGEEHTTLYINLNAAWRLFTNCEALSNLKVLSPRERERLLSEVVPCMGALPSPFCTRLLHQATRELPLTSHRHVELLLEMCDPFIIAGSAVPMTLKRVI